MIRHVSTPNEERATAMPGERVGVRERLRRPPRDPSDPVWRTVELVQRGRMILDVSAADLGASEAVHGPFHPTTWHFRNAWYEARRSWDRLRAELGSGRLDAALNEPPLTVLALGPDAARYTLDPDGRWPLPEPTPPAGKVGPLLLVWISGTTYRAARFGGTPLAPLIWRLTHLRLSPAYRLESPRPTKTRPRPAPASTATEVPPDDGPYFACRLRDGSTQCDCAEWVYRIADPDPDRPPDAPDRCKHLEALAALGWV